MGLHDQFNTDLVSNGDGSHSGTKGHWYEFWGAEPYSGEKFADMPVFVELAFWLVLYIIVNHTILRQIGLAFHSSHSYWEAMAAPGRRGLICPSVQDEVVYFWAIVPQHAVAGLFMMAAWVTGDDGMLGMTGAQLFKHGALYEVAFEAWDIFCMIFAIFPYGERPVQVYVLMSIHHITGLGCAIPVLLSGWAGNPYAAAIGGTMLFMASISGVINVYQHTLNIDTQAARMFWINLINTIGFVACRFGIFPWAIWNLIQDITHDGAHTWVVVCFWGAGATLSLFSALVTIDLIGKLQKFWGLSKEQKSSTYSIQYSGHNNLETSLV